VATWKVSDLIKHIAGGQYCFEAGAKGTPPAEGKTDRAPRIGDRWSGRRARSVALLLLVCSLSAACGSAGGRSVSPVWAVEQASGQGALHGFLDGVACPSATSCVAVGNAQGTGSGARALVERMAGSTWDTAVLALPARRQAAFLLGVACPSPVGCVAVGYGYSSQGGAPLIETLAKGRWSVTSAPALPSGAVGGYLRDVACADPESCVAVGSTYTGATSTHEAPWIATLANGAWQTVPSPGLGPASAVLNSVWCTDVTDCVAVGAQYGATEVTTLVETLSGGTWMVTPSPGSGSDLNAAGLTSVACQTAGACVAVGQLRGPTPPVLSATAGRWSAETGPTPNAVDGATGLWGVSCGSPSGCVAVGALARANSPSTHVGAIADPRGVLIERDDGGSWTMKPGPSGLPTTSGLRAVACVTQLCVAVGMSGRANGTSSTARTLILELPGA